MSVESSKQIFVTTEFDNNKSLDNCEIELKKELVCQPGKSTLTTHHIDHNEASLIKKQGFVIIIDIELTHFEVLVNPSPYF